ncbi:MAG: hypothetical protein WCL57_14355 [Chloroflexota bacterium]|nr:hypothetical protein [Chloroflexota bacterium]
MAQYQWRMVKGEICKAAFRVGINAFKSCGTSNTTNNGSIACALRDLNAPPIST